MNGSSKVYACITHGHRQECGNGQRERGQELDGGGQRRWWWWGGWGDGDICNAKGNQSTCLSHTNASLSLPPSLPHSLKINGKNVLWIGLTTTKKEQTKTANSIEKDCIAFRMKRIIPPVHHLTQCQYILSIAQMLLCHLPPGFTSSCHFLPHWCSVPHHVSSF